MQICRKLPLYSGVVLAGDILGLEGCSRWLSPTYHHRDGRLLKPSNGPDTERLGLLLILFESSETVQPILVSAFIDRFEQRRGQIAFRGVW